MILEAVRRVEKRNALDVASRVLQRVSAVYRYAIQTGRTTIIQLLTWWVVSKPVRSRTERP
jgi:hypothetical protein